MKYVGSVKHKQIFWQICDTCSTYFLTLCTNLEHLDQVPCTYHFTVQLSLKLTVLICQVLVANIFSKLKLQLQLQLSWNLKLALISFSTPAQHTPTCRKSFKVNCNFNYNLFESLVSISLRLDWKILMLIKKNCV